MGEKKRTEFIYKCKDCMAKNKLYFPFLGKPICGKCKKYLNINPLELFNDVFKFGLPFSEGEGTETNPLIMIKDEIFDSASKNTSMLSELIIIYEKKYIDNYCYLLNDFEYEKIGTSLIETNNDKILEVYKIKIFSKNDSNKDKKQIDFWFDITIPYKIRQNLFEKMYRNLN